MGERKAFKLTKQPNSHSKGQKFLFSDHNIKQAPEFWGFFFLV